MIASLGFDCVKMNERIHSMPGKTLAHKKLNAKQKWHKYNWEALLLWKVESVYVFHCQLHFI